MESQTNSILASIHQALHENDADPLLRAAHHNPSLLLERDVAERLSYSHDTSVYLRHQRCLECEQLLAYLWI